MSKGGSQGKVLISDIPACPCKACRYGYLHPRPCEPAACEVLLPLLLECRCCALPFPPGALNCPSCAAAMLSELPVLYCTLLLLPSVWCVGGRAAGGGAAWACGGAGELRGVPGSAGAAGRAHTGAAEGER